MAAVYPATLAALLRGDVDLDLVVKVQAVKSTYTYSTAHDFLNDVSTGSRIGTAQTLANKTFTAGVFDADPVSYTLTSTQTATGLVFYLSTAASDATRRLIYFENKNADTTPISHTGTGAAESLDWPRGGIFSI